MDGNDIANAISVLPIEWEKIVDELTVGFNSHFQIFMFRQEKVTDSAKLHSLVMSSPKDTASFDPVMRYYWFDKGIYQDFDLI